MTIKTLLLQGLLVFGAFSLFSSCGQSSGASENATSVRVLEAVNRERVSRGLGEVRFDGGLKKIAGEHASFLAKNVYPQNKKPTREMAHANFKERGVKAKRKKYHSLSEVVMIGYAGDLDAVAERTITGWMNSPGHRKSILDPSRRVMGVETRLPSDQRYFVVGLLSDGQVK